MKILLSPSKTKNIKGDYEENSYIPKTQEILKILKSLSVDTLQKKMKISKNKAECLHAFYNSPSFKKGGAILSYSGLVYKIFDIQEKDYAYIEKNVYILSAFYGILKPFQAIIEYRLDFNDRIIDKNYWKKEVNELLDKEEEILNLASKEYTSQIDKKMYNVKFLSKGQIKIKRAELLRKIVDARIKTIKDLKKIDTYDKIEGYNIYFK